jgi:hypothetical protein
MRGITMRKGRTKTDESPGSGAISRRGFLKSAAILAASASFPSHDASAAPRSGNVFPGRIAIEENLDATTGSTVNLTAVKDMVDHGLMALTGEANAVTALESLFPDLDAGKRIAIKVNCLCHEVPTRWEVVRALTDNMRLMIWGTYPPGNITIYDFDNGSSIVACGFTAGNFPDINITGDHDPDPGTQVEVEPGVWLSISSHIVNAAYLINCPVLKGHYAPFHWTVGFKNHIGSISPVQCHSYDPRLLTLNASPQFKDKTKLLVLSALHGMYTGGPWGVPESWILFPEEHTPNTVMLSTDPVAFERWGIYLIDEERQEHGLTIYDHGYCQNAAESPYDLGIYDFSRQEILTSLPAPETLTVSPAGVGGALLNWSAVTGAAKYRVYRSTNPYFTPDPWSATNLLTETTGTSYIDPAGTGNPNVNYYYIVRAFRACWESADSLRVAAFDYSLS